LVQQQAEAKRELAVVEEGWLEATAELEDAERQDAS
jgi:hypothetical protein